MLIHLEFRFITHKGFISQKALISHRRLISHTSIPIVLLRTSVGMQNVRSRNMRETSWISVWLLNEKFYWFRSCSSQGPGGTILEDASWGYPSSAIFRVGSPLDLVYKSMRNVHGLEDLGGIGRPIEVNGKIIATSVKLL